MLKRKITHRYCLVFFFQAEDGIRDRNVTGVQTCALPILGSAALMPPEKAGVWVCPYPTTFYNFRDFRPDAAFLDAMRDGRQTAFGIVSGQIGRASCRGRG